MGFVSFAKWRGREGGGRVWDGPSGGQQPRAVRETAGDRPIYLVIATMVMLTLVDADPLLTKSQSCYSAVRVLSQHQCDKEQYGPMIPGR